MTDQYLCSCSRALPLNNAGDALTCPACGEYIPIEDGIVRFTQGDSEQGNHFDAIYGEGYNNVEQKNLNSTRDEYQAHAPTALHYLSKAGFDPNTDIRGLHILDAACGAGWTAAAFYQHPNVNDCHIHAFDIAAEGVRRLKHYLAPIASSNTLSLSTQDALDMRFADNQFDLIVGSSILHHFDDYERYLEGCIRILKPDGKAIFGEPFAPGYGLLYSAMKIALNDLSQSEPTPEALYKDAAYRLTHHDESDALEILVDKHLFFPDEITESARRVGYQSVEILPLHDMNYIGNGLVDEMYNEMGIEDAALRERTQAIYSVMYDMFSSTKTFMKSLSPFNYVVLTR